jgi:hypothetical protein
VIVHDWKLKHQYYRARQRRHKLCVETAVAAVVLAIAVDVANALKYSYNIENAADELPAEAYQRLKRMWFWGRTADDLRPRWP